MDKISHDPAAASSTPPDDPPMLHELDRLIMARAISNANRKLGSEPKLQMPSTILPPQQMTPDNPARPTMLPARP